MGRKALEEPTAPNGLKPAPRPSEGSRLGAVPSTAGRISSPLLPGTISEPATIARLGHDSVTPTLECYRRSLFRRSPQRTNKSQRPGGQIRKSFSWKRASRRGKAASLRGARSPNRVQEQPPASSRRPSPPRRAAKTWRRGQRRAEACTFIASLRGRCSHGTELTRHTPTSPSSTLPPARTA